MLLPTKPKPLIKIITEIGVLAIKMKYQLLKKCRENVEFFMLLFCFEIFLLEVKYRLLRVFNRGVRDVEPNFLCSSLTSTFVFGSSGADAYKFFVNFYGSIKWYPHIYLYKFSSAPSLCSSDIFIKILAVF